MKQYFSKVLAGNKGNEELIRKVIEDHDREAFAKVFNLVIAEINKEFMEKYGE